MSSKQEEVLIPNPIAKFSLAEPRVYGLQRQGNIVYLLSLYDEKPHKMCFPLFMSNGGKFIVEKHVFPTSQQAAYYYYAALMAYNYRIDMAQLLEKSGLNSKKNELVEIRDKIQPEFNSIVNSGKFDSLDKKRLKTVEHPEFQPYIPADKVDFSPCLHSERINDPGMFFVYSLVLKPLNSACDEFCLDADVEIAGFITPTLADKYKEIRDNAYKNINMSAPKTYNQDALENMKRICNSIRVSSVRLRQKQI